MLVDRRYCYPQQNGRHERMDLTLKQEATKPAATVTHVTGIDHRKLLEAPPRFEPGMAVLQICRGR